MQTSSIRSSRTRLNALIVGSSGNVGSAVVSALKQESFSKKIQIIGTSTKFENENTRKLNLENPATYDSALQDVDLVFLNRPPQLTNPELFRKFTAKCKQHQVSHITYLSLLGVEKQSWNPHFKVESVIRESGIPYTFLRSGFFMQNLITNQSAFIKRYNEIIAPVGDAKTCFIDCKDLGEVAAVVMSSAGQHSNVAYELTGNEQLTYYQVADMMTAVLGRPIKYSNPSVVKYVTKMMERGEPLALTAVSTIIYLTARMGYAARSTETLQELLQRQPTTMLEFIQRNKDAWKI